MHPLKTPDSQSPCASVGLDLCLDTQWPLAYTWHKAPGILLTIISIAKNTFNNTFHAYGSALVTF